jgi:uncharacterized phage protein (TIGR02218 family)
MRPLTPGLQAHLETGATTLAWCWRVVRPDGAVFGFTDHDRDLSFDAVTFRAGQGWSAGAAEAGLGLAIDQASALGALNAAAITEADILAGRWDGAEVAAFRVNWADPAQRVRLWTGRIARLTRRDQAFEAELHGLQAALNATIGRVYSRFCDADLGDTRCGVSLAAPGRRATGIVTALLPDGRIGLSGLGAFTPARLAWGHAKALTGAAGGQTRMIRAAAPEGADLAVRLERAFSAAPAAGDQIQITIGCDKSFATCASVFSNALNFQGFPHMPGNDALASGPVEGAPLDGGRRS